jgi:hypothetical protein
VSDEDLRRAIRERDAKPLDAQAAAAAAHLVTRRGDRQKSAEAWQEVLRRDRLDQAAKQELVSLGCDLFFVGKNAQGRDEYESAIDGAILVSIPGQRTTLFHPRQTVDLAPFFVTREPITWAQYQNFLVRKAAAREEIETWINLQRGPLRWKGAFGSVSLRPDAAASYVLEVSWTGARAYALRARGDLPTEAQWELLTYGPRLDVALAPQRPASGPWSPYGVLGLDTLANHEGEWTLGSVPNATGEAKVLRGAFSYTAGHAPESYGTGGVREYRDAGFRYARDTWWKS